MPGQITRSRPNSRVFHTAKTGKRSLLVPRDLLFGTPPARVPTIGRVQRDVLNIDSSFIPHPSSFWLIDPTCACCYSKSMRKGVPVSPGVAVARACVMDEVLGSRE